ncbi:hypothetical protein [Xenophilus sp. Marseille-Q4582]|uniref:hypothetical protein n=1 Tax=Xenophilus sp. Marseille-Q4582 TaxID=2866600 RepID=UPI001CE4936C|nr:hypothetical protein [Xenophilus sp. Marseille-Q4582]
MSDIQLKALDKQDQDNRQLVELGDSLNRLRTNRDFKRVISQAYFKDEAVRLVHLKSDPNMQDAEKQKSIVAQIDAIGSFSAFLNTVMANAAHARRALSESEAMREEILEQGDDNE